MCGGAEPTGQQLAVQVDGVGLRTGSELVLQGLTQPVIDVEGVPTSARGIQGQHQQPVARLVGWALLDEELQHSDGFVDIAAAEQGRRQTLLDSGAKGSQAFAMGTHPVVVAVLGKQLTGIRADRLSCVLGQPCGEGPLRLLEEGLDVGAQSAVGRQGDHIVLEPQDIGGSTRCPQGPPRGMQRLVQVVDRRIWGKVGPERCGDHIAMDAMGFAEAQQLHEGLRLP